MGFILTRPHTVAQLLENPRGFCAHRAVGWLVLGMGVYSLFGDYSYGLRKVTLTLCGELNQNFVFKVVSPNILSFSEITPKIDVAFENLSITPASGELNSDSSGNFESVSFDATCLPSSNCDRRYSHVCERIVNGEMLRCKFCDGDIADIRNITKVDNLPSVDVLASSEPNAFFCHGEDSVPAVSGTPLSRLVASLPPSSVLCNGLEIILNSAVWISKSTKMISKLEGVFCSRCHIMLGRLVGSGADTVIVLWTISVKVWMQELDIDGDYLRHVELPLIQHDVDFFELLFSHMLEDGCYRFILSAGSYETPMTYALIWLFDQRSCLYTATIDTARVASACEGDASSHTEAVVVAADRTPVLKVLYRLLTPLGPVGPLKAADPLFDEWSRDFSVSHLQLPLETCSQLATCLSQITQRLAPRLRCGKGHTEGFTVGGVPVRA
ncbi:hypothetical protein TcWFU_000888 [Taenia crassiceps]|uniref:E3 ubiquitin-protein ligase E3D n=1 Tax=Taenia crassiceps TaxID=6207 RepID=A0ABR4QPE0_9CEST